MDLPTAPGQASSAGDVLDSWKAIAQYLNKDVRTLQRWESDRNLPVHRIPGGDRPSVYALKSELDAWRRGCEIHAVAEGDGSVTRDAKLPTIAVLPFLNLAGDKENEYFADGLADEIITALTRIGGLRVIARTSSFAFRGQDQDIRKIGARLGASAILEGSVRRAGGRIRVTAQLIDANDGCHLWGECYDREHTQIFTIQEEVSRQVIDALHIRLAASLPALKPQTRNSEAYRLWLMGRYHTQRQTPDQILRSRCCFEQAVALDPDFPQAHVGVAESWWECAVFGLESPREAVAIGRSAVSRALGMDSSGDAVSMLGVYAGVHDFDWPASERHFQRALELDPASPHIRRRYAAYLLEPMNRLREARAQLEKALEFDPLSPVLLAYLGNCIMFEGRFDEAAERLRQAVAMDPGCWLAQFMLGGAYAFQGQLEKALAIAEAAESALGSHPMVLGPAGWMYGFLGQSARAREYLQRLQAAGEIRYVSPLSVAWIYLGLGEVEACLDWLERAVEERDPLIIHFVVKPLYAPLRRHPRFQALVSKMRLAPNSAATVARERA